MFTQPSPNESDPIKKDLKGAVVASAVHIVTEKVDNNIPGVKYWAGPKIIATELALDFYRRVRAAKADHRSQSTTETLVCSAAGTFVGGIVHAAGSSAVAVAAPETMGGALLALGAVHLFGKHVGDGVQKTCHAITRQFAHPVLEPSTDLAIQSKQKELAALFLSTRKSFQPEVLDAPLEKIFGKENKEQINYTKEQFNHLQMLPQKAKEFSSEFKKTGLSPQLKEGKETTQRLQSSFHKFSETTAPLAQFVSGLGQLTGSRELQQIGVGIGSAVQIGETIAAVLVGSVNPVLGILGIAGCLSSLTGLFSHDEDPHAEAMQYIIPILYQMWSEFRAEFALLHKEIRALADMVTEGFVYLDHLMRNQHEAVIAKLDKINSNLLDSKSVMVEAIRECHLEAPAIIITEMKKSDAKGEAGKKPQKLSNQMFHWVQYEGGLCRGMHTGTHEQKTINIKDDKDFHKLNNLLKNPEELDSLVGFLATMAKQLVNGDQFKEVNTNALFNPELWSRMTDAYVVFRSQFIQEIQDKNNEDLDSVLDAGCEFFNFVWLVCSTPELYSVLFKGYEDALLGIQNIISDNVANENKAINDKKEESDSFPVVDISQKAEDIIDACKNKMPLWYKLDFYYSDAYQNNKLVNCNGLQGKYGEIRKEDRSEISAKIPPHFILLEYLRMANFNFLYQEMGTKSHLCIQWQFHDKPFCIILTADFKPISNGLFDRVSLDKNRNAKETRLKQVWNKIGLLQSPAVPDKPLLEKIKTEALNRINAWLLSKRKKISEDIQKQLDIAYQKLDGFLNLLRCYSHFAGFGKTEISKLYSSTQLKAAIEGSIKDVNLPIFMPHTALSSDLKTIKDNILKIVGSSELENFQSIYFQKVYQSLFALETLKFQSSVLCEIKLNNQITTQNELSESLSRMAEELLTPYYNMFSRWKSFHTHWLNSLKDEAKEDDAYENCQKHYGELSKLFNEIDKLLENKNWKDLIVSIKNLEQLSKELHNDFLTLNLFASGEPYYRLKLIGLNKQKLQKFTDDIQQLSSVVDSVTSKASTSKSPFTYRHGMFLQPTQPTGTTVSQEQQSTVRASAS